MNEGKSRLQDIIDKFNIKINECEKIGYNKSIKKLIFVASDSREGLIDAYWDPACYDKEDIKKDIIEFTKIIIRLNIIAQKHFNPHIKMDTVDEQLKQSMKTDNQLIKIFKI